MSESLKKFESQLDNDQALQQEEFLKALEKQELRTESYENLRTELDSPENQALKESTKNFCASIILDKLQNQDTLNSLKSINTSNPNSIDSSLRPLIMVISLYLRTTEGKRKARNARRSKNICYQL